MVDTVGEDHGRVTVETSFPVTFRDAFEACRSARARRSASSRAKSANIYLRNMAASNGTQTLSYNRLAKSIHLLPGSHAQVFFFHRRHGPPPFPTNPARCGLQLVRASAWKIDDAAAKVACSAVIRVCGLGRRCSLAYPQAMRDTIDSDVGNVSPFPVPDAFEACRCARGRRSTASSARVAANSGLRSRSSTQKTSHFSDTAGV